MKILVDTTGWKGKEVLTIQELYSGEPIWMPLTDYVTPNSIVEVDDEFVWQLQQVNGKWQTVDWDCSDKSQWKHSRQAYQATGVKEAHPILGSTLIVDNVSEALYECIEEGSEDFSMLICEVIDKNGNKCQVHIKVTYNENDFIPNDEEMPTFAIDEEYRLSHEIL